MGAEGPDLRRRALFRAALSEPNEPALARLQRSGRLGPGTRFAHAVRFDGYHCTGCNACVQICPASAMADVNDATGASEYKCDISSCLGSHAIAMVQTQHARRNIPAVRGSRRREAALSKVEVLRQRGTMGMNPIEVVNIPPAEAEANFCATQETEAMAA